MSFLDKLKKDTRWDNIPDLPESYRLLCNSSMCSLSCANLRDGRLSVTSVHGAERHSQTLTKKEMAFISAIFLNSLSEYDMLTFLNIYNNLSPENTLSTSKSNLFE